METPTMAFRTAGAAHAFRHKCDPGVLCAVSRGGRYSGFWIRHVSRISGWGETASSECE